MFMSNFLVSVGSLLYSCLYSSRKTPEPSTVSEVHPLDIYVENEIMRLGDDINDLKSKIKKIDDFVSSHPELMSTVQVALKNYKPLHGEFKKPLTTHLDPRKPIDHLTLLKYEKIELEAHLDERKLFVELNETVAECFRKCLSEGSTPISGGIGLLCDRKG